jgi:predicted phage terminase large subunit-like protein
MPMIQIKDHDRLLIERELAKKSLAEFVRMAWRVLEPTAELKWGWALDAICEHLEAVTSGEILNLLINVPPGMMKSLMVSVFWPAWGWGAIGRPDLRYLGTSYGFNLALRDNLKCKRLIESQWYQERWPITIRTDQNSKTKFENPWLGFREAMAFQSMTGSRGDRVILDDPLSVKGARSEADLLTAEITFTEALPTRINNEESSQVIIMQRLHERDTSGLIISKELNYERLVLPMEFEQDRRCETSIGFTDPRTQDGELVFPERFSQEQVNDLKATMGSYAVAGQFQQRPAPREGGLFKRHWFNFVDSEPDSALDLRGWDLAASVGQQAAYTAGVKIGKQKNGRFVIKDARRGQLTPGEVERMIVSTASEDGKRCKVSIPQDPGQAGKSQAQYLVKRLAGFRAKATLESGDKVTRAEPMAAQAEAGNIDIVKADWNETYLDELCTFPYGAYADQVDASSRAFNALLESKAAYQQDIVGLY